MRNSRSEPSGPRVARGSRRLRIAGQECRGARAHDRRTGKGSKSLMRLVHYYPRALVGDGGPTRAMWEWVNATQAAGCDVRVLYDAGLEAPSTLRNPAIPTIPLPHTGVGRFRAPRGLGDELRHGDVLVLHSVYLPGNVAAAMAAQRCSVPYIVMPHGG